jgi:hypothetical protein
MKTKRKISFTIDEDIFNAIEEAAEKYNMAKSHVAQKALELWLKQETEALMAEGYLDMAEEDRAFTEMSFRGQREIVS